MTGTYADHISAARTALRQAHRLLIDEMRTYPTPISGCDAQYNYLVGERNRVLAALGELEREVFVATPRRLAAGAGVESR